MRNLTSWCIACNAHCGNADDNICETCRGYVVTYHMCPRCSQISRFFGYDMPDQCVCKYVWPDIISLKEEQSARVKYHTGVRA